uniref:Uncharacterized protein n=1 Tax=Plectus sambesii TaxID=2011161 RepID=A0A914W5E6_9BILA
MPSYSATFMGIYLLTTIPSLLIFVEAQQSLVFRSCSDVATRGVGYNYIKYSGSVESVWARPFSLSPSSTTNGVIFNQTVAQLPQVPSPITGQLTVPLLIRQNFTEDKWYLVCAQANNTDCSKCDVVFRQNCQNPSFGRSFIDFTVTKNNPGYDRVGITVIWQSGRGVLIPFDYIVQVEVKWSPFFCANQPFYSSLSVNGLQCGRPSTSRAYSVKYGDPFALSGMTFDQIAESVATMFTVSITVELQIGDTVRRLYPGTNIQDSYVISLPQTSFARYANNQQVLPLLIPFENTDTDFDALRTCTQIDQNVEKANGTTTTITPAPQQSAHRFNVNKVLVQVGIIAFVYHKLQL